MFASWYGCELEPTAIIVTDISVSYGMIAAVGGTAYHILSVSIIILYEVMINNHVVLTFLYVIFHLCMIVR